MKLADTHTHLHFSEFEKDRNQVIERALRAGVKRFITVGADIESSREAIKLAEEHEFIYATVGIHPHDAKSASPAILKEIEGFISHPKVVAVGEIGLDFYRNLSDREVQKVLFKTFLFLGKKYSKPFIIHCRDAYEEMELIFKQEEVLPWNGVMHCFSSDYMTMKKFLNLGFFISFSGILTYKKSDLLREACAKCPIDRLLIETDAPYLAPQSNRGKRNEPVFIIETLELIAKLKGMKKEDLAEQLEKNTNSAFRL